MNSTFLDGDCAQAFKFGNTQSNCLKAIDIAFELAPKASSSVYKSAMKTLAMVSCQLQPLCEAMTAEPHSHPWVCCLQAHKKFLKDGGSVDDSLDVLVPDPESVR